MAGPQSRRLTHPGTGVLLDRERHLTVTFEGEPIPAHPGDTLASALLAAGVGVHAAGPETGRPRGVHAAEASEPCAFVHLDGEPGETMVPAPAVEARHGLSARRLSGRGDPGAHPDTARYDHAWAHCDVLVVGAGPAGVEAARQAASGGARVVLADDQPGPGGALRRSRPGAHTGQDLAGVLRRAEELGAHEEVRILPRTTVTGHYAHGFLTALQRRTDHLAEAPAGRARHRLWHLRAAEVVVATGTVERPIAFAGNDLPGVMLAGAAAGYAWGFGVAAGRRAVVFGAHDAALWAAVDLAEAGITLAAVVDARPAADCAAAAELERRGIEVLFRHGVSAARGDATGHLAQAAIAPLDDAARPRGATRRVECDLLAVSGGADPALALLTQAGGTLAWDPARAAWSPASVPAGLRCVGAAAGEPSSRPGPEAPPAAVWCTAAEAEAQEEVFVDLARDATLADMHSAVAAGMVHPEHHKRYTSIGTGPDQGRTSSTVVAGLLAELTGRGIAGSPRRRPPLAGVPFAAVAGRHRGDFLDPVRRTPMHEWHKAAGAVFEDVGQWKRPRYYPRGDGEAAEDMTAAVRRECRAAREGVAVLDASTLGKIVVEGRDAPQFLDRIYSNMFSTLPVGRSRYGVMCGVDGMVFDDGVSLRLAEDRYLMTTTSGNGERVLAWLEDWLQTEWPELCVHCTPVTEQWAVAAVVGPRARDVVAALSPGLDLDPSSFALMEVREAPVAGISARILRVSFSGELTYEISVPWWYGQALWQAVMDAGRPYGITPYGTETMHVLRAEKGFIVVGHETDGTTTPPDAGLGWAVSRRKDFVGKRSLSRTDTARGDRHALVGLRPSDGRTVISEGAQLIERPPRQPPVPMLGHVTSAYPVSTAGPPFALALLEGGSRRHGQTLYAYHLGRSVAVQVTEPVFYDPEGARRDG